MADVYGQWNEGELAGYLTEITSRIFRREDPRTNQYLIDMILDKARQKGTGMWTSQDAMELGWLSSSGWIGPGLLALILVAELIFVIVSGGLAGSATAEVEPKQVGTSLFGPYLLGVELASFLLLAGLVGAYHLGRRDPPDRQERSEP